MKGPSWYLHKWCYHQDTMHEEPESLQVSLVPPVADDGPVLKAKKGLHWISAGLILFGFAAPGALVGVPFAIGTTGYVLGMVVCVVVVCASACGAGLILELSIAHPQCKNLPDLGEACMGVPGRRMAASFQMLNFIGFLPISLLINGLALQGALGVRPDACIDAFILAVSVVCFATTQVRTLSNTQTLALVSLAAIVIAAFLALGVVLSHPNTQRTPTWFIGHPDWTSSWTELIRTCLGLTTTAWSYVPAFLTVELSSAMSEPRHFRRSLVLSAGLAIVLFLIIGVPTAYRWGWKVPDPLYAIDAWPAHGAASRIMQALILVSNLVSYALDSVPLARFCQVTWLPGFRDDWSVRSIAVYALISLPTFLFGLVASLSVGNLLSMLAWVTALSVPFINHVFPSIFYISHRRRTAQVQISKPFGRADIFVMGFVLMVGILSFMVCAAAALGKVIIKDLRGPTVIGCGKWLVYSDADSFKRS